MVLGTGKGTKWTEIEADEAVFDKCLIAAEDVSHPSRTMKWDQWLGMVPRGKPSSLVLFRLRSLTTHKRAPAPGAVRKDDWVKIANAWLKDRSIILHTDSARSYRTKIRGVLHDAVIHQGKWVWKSPTFVRLAKHRPEDHRQSRDPGDRQGMALPQGPGENQPKREDRVYPAGRKDQSCPIRVLAAGI